MNVPFMTAMRQLERRARLNKLSTRNEWDGPGVYNHVHVEDRAVLADANDLIAHYGELAQFEAAQRADRSRSLGNVIHFCRWRQVERTIAMLSDDEVTGTIH